MKKGYTFLALFIAFIAGINNLNAQCLTAPFTESFDAGTQPSCILISATSGGPWDFNGIGWNTSGCSPAPTDNTGNSGFFASMDQSGTDAGVIMEFDTIDVTSLTSPYLQFYYTMCGVGYSPVNILHVESFDGTTWVGVDTIQQGTNGWELFAYDLSTHTFGTNLLKVRFRAESGGSGIDFYGDQGIDDISVTELPTCFQALSLTTSSISNNSADISWTDPNSATSYEIEYGVAPFALGSGTRAVVSTNPHTISGLTDNTDYEWHVRVICAVGDTSAWSGPASFRTTCNPFTVSYTNGFDGTIDPLVDPCWTVINATTSTGWVETENSAFDPQRSAPNAIEFYNAAASSGNLLLVSPQFSDLDNTKQIRFFLQNEGSTAYTSDLIVGTMSDPNIDTTFEAYDTIPNAAFAFNTWTEFIIPFSSLTNGDKYVAFRHGLNGTFDYIFMDDFTYQNIPSCPQPVSLTEPIISYNTADLAWVESGVATTWQIQYDTTGFTPGTGNFLVTTTNPVTITGLTGQSTYDWYVRAICGAADTSAWSGPNTFTTLCAPLSSPWTDDVELHSPTTGLTSSLCWTATANNTTNDWNIDGAGSTPSTGTGPSAANSGTNYFYFEASGGTAGNEAYLETPLVNLSGLTVPRLTFYYHMYGAQNGVMADLFVDIWDGTSYTTVDSIIGEQQTNQADPFLQRIIDLSSYSGIVSVRFTAKWNGPQWGDISLDDFAIEETPQCPAPLSLSANSVSADTAQVIWTEQGSATQYEIEWDTAGYVTGNAANSAIVNIDTFYTFTALNPVTAYDWAVRAICGVADTSNWATASFTTPIQGPQGFTCTTGNFTTIFSDDLETTGGWTGNIGGGLNNWNYDANGTPSSGTGPLSAHSGNQYVFVETSGAGTGTPVSFVSPVVDLSAGNNFAELSFWLHMFGGNIGTLNVGVGTSATGPFTNLFSVSGQQQATQGSPWINAGINLNAYVGQTIYIEFEYLTNGSFAGDIALDLIEVNTCASCLSPSNLADTLSTLTSVDVSWVENGTATNWEVEYGPTGFTPGAGTKVVTTSNPLTLTGLPVSTQFDFYVRSICGPADTSAYSSIGGFATLNGVPYLETWENTPISWSSVSGTNPRWLFGGSTGSGGTGPAADHTIGTGGTFAFLETSAPSSAGQTDTLISPEITVGSTQTTIELSFWYHMHGATIGQLQAWIVTSGGVATLVDTITGQQQPNQADPWLESTTILNGYADSTVRIVFVGVAGSSFTGDLAVDDISLDVPPSADLGITDIISPTSGCGLGAADSVEVEITNFGIAAQSNFSIGYSLNGVAITPETVSATLGVGMSMNYTFATTANLSTSGAYDIVAYTALTGDADNTNDTAATTINSFASVSSFPYTESFETGPADWTVLGNTTFELGVPNNTIIDTASNGTQAWVTDLDANYLDNELGFVYSPCFDFTNVPNPYIEMDLNWDIENSWDGAVLQATTDGGATWTKVGDYLDTVNWYNDNTIDALIATVEPSGEGWTGTGANSSQGWVTAKHYLDGMGGLPAVQLRVVFTSDVSVNEEGIAFDNVNIYDRTPPVPYYPIGVINTVDANGVADSLNVEVRTSGTVVGIDLDGNNGFSFTIIDMSTSVQEGINIFNFNDVSGYTVTEGDSIMVWGDIDQFNGLQEVFVDSIMVIASGRPIPAPIVTNSINESTESRWVELASDFIMLDPSGTGGGSYNMDATNGTDTITIRVDSDTDVHDSLLANQLLIGDTICFMRGTGGQFDNSNPYTSGYQLFPNRWVDMQVCRLPVGIEEANETKSQLSIYPNPTTGNVTIQANKLSTNNARIMVRDISGKIMFEDAINQSDFSTTIDFTNRANGIYFITIIDGENMIHEKLIKN